MRSSKFIVLLCMASMLCSCAAATMVDSWRNPSIRVPRLQRVLVVSITKKDASRRVYEDMIASELAKRGVNAIPGYDFLPQRDKADWSALKAAVDKASAQAVLTMQTIKVSQQTTIQPGYVTSYPGNWYPEAFPTWDLYGYYGSMANYGPAYISTYDIATMQVNLFDAATGKLLWAATLESNEPEKVVSVGKEVAQLIAQSLSKEGLI